ncbi:MAG TPA: penicillin-binding protein 2 [Vicinamibacterales bacterium]|jgi:penicillin-binding protein 2|nr:penicillin-binding protein 2 [Vicinamibacterales bacterium]
MPDDRRGLTIRLSVLQYLVAGIFAMLAVGFWIFQIAQHEKFREMAENNQTRRLPLPAPRGVLLDRNGKILVENQDTINIAIVREQTKDLGDVLRTLAMATGVPEAQLRDTLSRRRREPSYRPIVLIENASQEQYIAVRARSLELPGIIAEPVPARRYPGSDMAAHLFGYVGEVTPTQLQRPEYDGVEPGSVVGQAGVELAYNKMLMGTDGSKTVVVNSVGREIKELERQLPATGRPLQLTLDEDLQKATEDGFTAAGFNGAAVVVDPRNGEVLAFTSRPAYDPNEFAAGIKPAAWNALTSDNLKPLQNRALQSRYPPGSTFKPAVGLAGLEEGVISPNFTVHCVGGATFYGRHFACWKKGGHGTVNLKTAIEQSCDVFFYTVGNMLGIDKINKWATLLGLGVKSNIDLPNELVGLVPSSQWKQETRHEKWYAGETISVAIGQGQVNVTPVSMAVYAATLANGGTRITPHIIKAADNGNGLKALPEPPPQSKIDVSAEKLEAIRQGMWGVVNGGGTGGRARIEGHDVCGKTGTAQVISNQNRLRAQQLNKNADFRDNGWFIFFAPRDNPTVAGVVFLEHGLHGPNAASVAHHILATYFAKQDGKPLPPPPTHEDLHLDYKDPYARGGAPAGGGGH